MTKTNVGGAKTLSETDDKLSLPTCVGWGVGSVGMMTLLGMTNGLILKYIVDFLSLSAILAGGLIATTRILDAVIDPFIGMLSDRTHSRWGRRRPYLLVGSVLCALTPLILFSLPQQFDPGYTTVLIVTGLLFYSVAHTTFNVPYIAMPVEMTQSPFQRTRLFSFRIYGTAIGSLLGGALAPWLVTEFGGDAGAFAGMSYVMTGVVLAACMTCFWMTGKAPTLVSVKPAERPKLADIRLVSNNRPYMYLLLAKVFLIGGTGISGSAMAFFVTHVLDEPLSKLGFLMVLTTIGLVGSQSFWLKLARRHGKRVCFLVAAAGYILVSLSWLLAGPGEPQLLLGARAIVLGFIGGGTLLSSQAMLPDCLEHEYVLTGVRHEGSITGLYTTVERGASAMGVAIAGFILSAGGYVGGGDVADPDAIQAIYVCVGVMPAVMLLASMTAIYKYDLPD